MTPDQTVAEFIAAIERHDVAAAVAMLADEVSYENMPMDPITGAETVARVLEGFLAPATEVEWRIDAQWEFGSTVVNERLDRFKIGAGWLELPVAGFFEVNDEGRITLWRDYFDMTAYTSQLERLTPRE